MFEELFSAAEQRLQETKARIPSDPAECVRPDEIKKLTEDLDFITNSVLSFGKSCLNELVNIDARITAAESDLNEINGTMRIVKDSKSIQRDTDPITPPLPAPDAAPTQTAEAPTVLDIPTRDFIMNFDILPKIGVSLDQISNGEVLIKKIQPGEPKVQLWTRHADYFLEQGKDIKVEDRTSTFSEVYGIPPNQVIEEFERRSNTTTVGVNSDV